MISNGGLGVINLILTAHCLKNADRFLTCKGVELFCYWERERTCKINHRDQRTLAENMRREPLIHSLELEWSVEPDVGDHLADPGEDQLIKFTRGPFTNAYTSAPETPITDPTTFALPCHFPTLMPSILKITKKTDKYFKLFSFSEPSISALLDM